MGDRDHIDIDELEAELGISIPTEERMKIRTIADAVEYLEKHPPTRRLPPSEPQP